MAIIPLADSRSNPDEYPEVIVEAPQSSSSFNIANFRSQLPFGVLKTNIYRIEIFVPPFLTSNPNNNQVRSATPEKLTFLCAAAAMPGVRIATKQIKRYGQGTFEKMPFGYSFDDIPLYFIGDGEGIMLKFFRDWTRGIIEYSTDGTGAFPVGFGNVQNRAMRNGDRSTLPFYTNYKTDYRTQINIVSFSDTGHFVADKLSLFNAFPVDIRDIQLNWSDNNQLMLIPVTFSFFDYFEQEWNEDFLPENMPGYRYGLNLIERVYKGITGVQAVKAILKKPQNVGDIVNIVNTTSHVIKNIFK